MATGKNSSRAGTFLLSRASHNRPYHGRRYAQPCARRTGLGRSDNTPSHSYVYQQSYSRCPGSTVPKGRASVCTDGRRTSHTDGQCQGPAVGERHLQLGYTRTMRDYDTLDRTGDQYAQSLLRAPGRELLAHRIKDTTGAADMTNAARVFRWLLDYGTPAMQDMARRILEMEHRKRFPTRCTAIKLHRT